MSLLRPNRATITRVSPSGATSNTGQPVPADPVTVYSSLPCMIEGLPIRAEIVTSAGSQPVTEQRYTMYCDGRNVPSGTSPGSTVQVTMNGEQFNFIVDGIGVSAFPNIKKGDNVVDDRGQSYRVMTVQPYSGVLPNIQIGLELGKGH